MKGTISSRKIIIFLILGFCISVAASLIISKKLSNEITQQTRDRELALIFGAIEAGPLAIARLQSAAIAQDQLSLLMSNSQLRNRGFNGVSILGGPNLSYTFGNWNSGAQVAAECLEEIKKDFRYADALNPFLVKVTRNACQPISEQRQIFLSSAVASLSIAFITLIMLTISVRPVTTSLRVAESVFTSGHSNLKEITFRPIQTLVKHGLRSAELEREQALTTLAQQVAHDIRSPLSALNMALGLIKEIPEEKLALIRAAVNRINDIANSLIQRRKILIEEQAVSTDAARAIEQIIFEKRAQLADRRDIEVNATIEIPSGQSIPMENHQFSRILSNLINNSIEALPNGGQVNVLAKSTSKKIELSVIDNGLGMPAEVAAAVGLRSVTHGKPHGSGLGLMHAVKLIEQAGGTLAINSKERLGTEVRITFLKA